MPRLADLVPFTALADGLPTPVEQVADTLWVQRDDLTATTYGGNKVRKLEFVLPVAERRGGPVVTAGGTGSHHVLATASYAERLGLAVEAVVYPQPETDDTRHTAAALAALDGVRLHRVPHRYLMPAAVAGLLARLAPRRPYLLWPGASTPLGTLGYVSAGLELVAAFEASGWPEPDRVVVPLGSGGTAVGTAVGARLGGWHTARVVAVRAADALVTNAAVLRSLEAGTVALLALAGVRPPGPARLDVAPGWLGAGYGHPTPEGEQAMARAAAGYGGLALEPTYTAKAFACALALVDEGRRVAYVHTFGRLRPRGAVNETSPHIRGKRGRPVSLTFLSDEWIDEVRKIRDEMGEMPTPPGLQGLQVNLVVAGGPDGDKDFHLDGAAGGFEINPGHIDGAPTKVTIPFETAKAMFVNGDQAAAMQAFMAGQIKVEGDMTRLMALQAGAGQTSPEQQEFQSRIQAITA